MGPNKFEEDNNLCRKQNIIPLQFPPVAALLTISRTTLPIM